MMEIAERPVADQMEGVAIPAQCERVVGHDAALQQLFDGYKSGRMHHAWMLSGPRGMGKASLALWFAKFMLSAPDRSQLGTSFDPAFIAHDMHRQVAQGAHPSLLHLTRPWDEKAKRFKTQLSVEEVRRTRSFYGMTSGAGGWRITIIDAVDEMNASASNALLKILEEPPKNSLFFVLSHATGRPLATIRSRCQALNLQPLSDDHCRDVLSHLKVQASEADLALALKLGEGSVRRVVQLMDAAVLKDFRGFSKLMEARAVGSGADWTAAHSLAEKLSRRGSEDTFRLFLDLVFSWIAAQVRNPENATPADLAGWADVWDKANETTIAADVYNLDKRQVILSLFGDLFERNRLS